MENLITNAPPLRKKYLFIYKKFIIYPGDVAATIIALIIMLPILFMVPMLWWARIIIVVVGLVIWALLIWRNDDELFRDLLWDSIKFLFIKKSFIKGESKIFFQPKKIEDNHVSQKDKQVTTIYRILGNDISLISAGELEKRIRNLSHFYQQAINVKIIAIDSTFNFKEDINYWKTKDWKKPINKLSLYDNVEQIMNIDNNSEVLEKQYYLIFNSYNKNSNVTAYNKISIYLNAIGVVSQKATLREINMVNEKFWNCNLDDTIKKWKVNNLNFTNRFYKINKKFYCTIGVKAMPLVSHNLWLTSLYKIENATIITNIRNIDSKTSEKYLKKSYIYSRDKYANIRANDLIGNINANDFVVAVEQTASWVANGVHALKETETFILIEAKKYKALLKRKNEIITELKLSGFKCTANASKQLDSFKSIIPNSDIKCPHLNINILSNSLGMGYPFTSIDFVDEKGFYLGLSSSGTPVSVNLHTKNMQRNSFSSIFLGKNGGGKTYAVSKIIKNKIIDGNNKIFIIDPKRDYYNLVTNFGGEYIDMAGLSPKSKRINPFQVFMNETSDEGTHPLIRHYRFLEEFFTIVFPKLASSSTDLSLLNKYIKIVYQKKKIRNDTNISKLQPKDWPIWEDLYLEISKAIKKCKIDDFDLEHLYTLKGYLQNFSKDGNFASIWNGPTNIDLAKSDLICFDIQKLISSGGDRIANAQLYLMLTFMYTAVIENKDYNDRLDPNLESKWIDIFVDEGHVLTTAKNKQPLYFLFTMFKTIRGYHGGVHFVNQNIQGLMGTDETKEQTTAMIDNAQYIFIFPLNPNDINNLNTLFASLGGITENEKEFLSMAQVGHCIFAPFPTSRFNMRINVSPFEEELFNKKLSLDIINKYINEYEGGTYEQSEG